MDDNRLDEFKGDVDFDFFDDGDTTTSDNIVKDVVTGKPPAARKSPNPPATPSKSVDLKLDLTNAKPADNSETESESCSSTEESESDTEHVNKKGQVNGDFKKSVSPVKQKESKKSDEESKNRSASSCDSSDSDSDSYTDSFSEVSNDNDSKQNGKNGVKTSGRSKRRNVSSSASNSSSYTSASSESDLTDDDDDKKKKPFNKPSTNSPTRPKTAHHRNSRTEHNDSRDEAWTQNVKNKRPSDKNSRKVRLNDSQNKKDEVSESEGEITDVSPLASPQNSPKKNKKHNHINHGHGDASHNQHETLDLNLLVDAVSELDKDRRIKANTRRVMFAPPKVEKRRDNYSYSNERAKMIEKENQRLLNEILQHVHHREKSINTNKYEYQIRRMTPSAINREKQQRKIEMENMALLRRLKNAKPTKGMSKAEQDKEYHKTMLYGVPVSSLHASRPKSRSNTAWDDYSTSSRLGSRTRSMTSIHSAASTSTIGSAQSTFRRPASAKKDRRPEWSDRW